MILTISILITILYIVIVWFDLDRILYIWWVPLERYASKYLKKPSARAQYPSINKVIVIIQCNRSYCDMTLKSILDQCVKVDEIDIQTKFPDKFKFLTKIIPILNIKSPHVDKVGERDQKTVKIEILNGQVYSYDYIEKSVQRTFR